MEVFPLFLVLDTDTEIMICTDIWKKKKVFVFIYILNVYVFVFV